MSQMTMVLEDESQKTMGRFGTWPIYSEFYQKIMVMFHSLVRLQEGMEDEPLQNWAITIWG